MSRPKPTRVAEPIEEEDEEEEEEEEDEDKDEEEGSCITKHRDELKDVKRRVGLANNAHHFLLPIMKSRDEHRQTEKKLYKTLIRSLLWYGSEA